MSPGALGAFLLVLVVVFVLGNLWFHLVESLLRGIKRLLLRDQKPQAWHPLPPEQPEEKTDVDQE